MHEKLNQHKLYLQSFYSTGKEGKEGAQLSLTDDDFSGCDFSHQDFSNATLVDVNFRNANLQNAEFDGCIGMWGSIFDDANMSFAKIRKATADEASFRNTILTNASLRRTTLFRTNFWGAKLDDTDLVEAMFVDADLRNANLGGANLYQASFDRCKVNGIYLNGAKNVDTVFTEWIDIGANDIPLILKGEDAKEWLIKQAQE